MSRSHATLPLLFGAVTFTVGFAVPAGAQTSAGRTGPAPGGPGAAPAPAARSAPLQGTTSSANPGLANAPQLSATGTTAPAAGASTQTGTLPALPDASNRDVILSPTQANQQFLQQRATELNAPAANAAATSPGTTLPTAGTATATPGTVLEGQVVRIVPGRSVTIRDVSGLVRTFPLPASYTIPSDVAPGTLVVVTTQDGGFVDVANASGVFPASAVAGGTGEGAPNVTQVEAANGNIYRPNLTTQQVPVNTVTGIGGFYFPSQAAPGYTESAPGAAAPALGGGTFAANAPTGVPALPVTSLSYNPTPLASLVAQNEGMAARLPNTALRGGALATITGTGRDLVTHTALPTYRVVSWDGRTLVVTDDHGARHRFVAGDRTRMPRNLRAGKLVLVSAQGDVLRSVRYLL